MLRILCQSRHQPLLRIFHRFDVILLHRLHQLADCYGSFAFMKLTQLVIGSGDAQLCLDALCVDVIILDLTDMMYMLVGFVTCSFLDNFFAAFLALFSSTTHPRFGVLVLTDDIYLAVVMCELAIAAVFMSCICHVVAVVVCGLQAVSIFCNLRVASFCIF